MAITYTYDCLAYSKPADTNLNSFYAVPASSEIINTVLTACNLDSVERTIRVCVNDGVGGDVYLEYDTPVPVGVPIKVVFPGLANGYTIYVKTSTANIMHFTLMGLKKVTT